jgi:DNA/RNA-binding domain of Phe-tRNA-synthetase-like protein
MTEQSYTLAIDPTLCPSPVFPALIWAEAIAAPTPTIEAPGFLLELIVQIREQGESFIPTDLRQRVRRMLRHGKYRPSGRGKPASEFLLRAALADAFPLVNGPVDVNNAISLASGFPGSIFNADCSGTELLLRRGRPGEAYVFNPAGQVIDLEDLLLVCRRTKEGFTPCGNPVKDAMATKIYTKTRNVVAVLYAPANEPAASVERWGERYAALLSTHCRAKEVGFEVLTP